MRPFSTPLAAFVLLAPALAAAQVRVDVSVALPTIQFSAPPPLVVVAPGVQVVRDYDEEVYVSNGWYWTRREGHWFRCRDHHGRWVVVERGLVPAAVARLPPGQYRKYKPQRGHGEGHDRDHGKHGRGHER
jgi:hypothetical protein